MITKTTFRFSALVVILLLLVTTQIYALNYSINFTASGVTSSVGNVQVDNLTKGTTVYVPDGNTLNLTDVTDVDKINANETRIHISQNASKGSFNLTFYADLSGNTHIGAFTLDGRKVVEHISHMDVGDNSIEISLPVGMYVIRIFGKTYTYSAKLLNLKCTTTQAEIKFLRNNKAETAALLKSKATPVTTMVYTTGDQLLYTATSRTYIASVPDVPTGSKLINFIFFKLPSSAIPAGNFIMGSPLTEVDRDTNEAQHTVTLTAFYMSKYEITNSQFADFLNVNNIGESGIWATASKYPTRILIKYCPMGLYFNNSIWVSEKGYENYPVVNVTWYGAAEFANYIGGKLPTEAQWEFACRAGTTTPFNTGDSLTKLFAFYHWSEEDYPSKTNPIGTYAPNAYGLYDMHGNVYELCSDFYGPYQTTAQTNPTGPETVSYPSWVIRGGSWNERAYRCRSARRYFSNPGNSNWPGIYDLDVGFRVAFVP